MSAADRFASRATALRYDQEKGGAPTVIASGRGLIAEAILERAHAAGVPAREDAALCAALAQLELGVEIPEELYAAVAEALVWAYRLSSSAGRSRPAG